MNTPQSSRFFSSNAAKIGLIAVIVLLVGGVAYTSVKKMSKKDDISQEAKPALTVELTNPTEQTWNSSVTTNGKIAAWQEASIGAQVNGLQLSKVLVNVGDTVHKGQTLAIFSSGTVNAERARAEANVEAARANLALAAADTARANKLKGTGAISEQQILQYSTAHRSAAANLKAAQAASTVSNARVSQTIITAPDHGLISARNATVGSVAQAGQEMFRLILQNRLEWRADLSADQIKNVQPGASAQITLSDGETLKGTVRQISPILDEKTNSATVYVDLIKNGGARAGMFAKGTFEMGARPALTLPQTAVVQRDGFYYVFSVDTNNKVKQTKVETGRIQDGAIEIISGINPSDKLVASGADFLKDGDLVKIVTKK